MDYHSDRAVLHPGRRLTCLFEPTQGEIVARAKRTDRAEARRRYRAYLAEQTEAEAAKGGEDEERRFVPQATVPTKQPAPRDGRLSGSGSSVPSRQPLDPSTTSTICATPRR